MGSLVERSAKTFSLCSLKNDPCVKVFRYTGSFVETGSGYLQDPSHYLSRRTVSLFSSFFHFSTPTRNQDRMGGELCCPFKEGIDDISVNTCSSMFGTVGCVLRYMADACALLRFQDSSGLETVSFTKAAPLNMGG